MAENNFRPGPVNPVSKMEDPPVLNVDHQRFENERAHAADALRGSMTTEIQDLISRRADAELINNAVSRMLKTAEGFFEKYKYTRRFQPFNATS